jgi:serine/threonine-protein kinase
MTPDDFRKAQQLFLDAVEVPEDRRGDYVRHHAGSDEIVAEVLSLLRYHDNETLLTETSPLAADMPQGFAETRAFESGEGPGNHQTIPDLHHAPPPVVRAADKGSGNSSNGVGRLDVEPSDDLSVRFARSTVQLLRRRLIAATFVLGGILIAVTLAVAIFGELVPVRLAVRGVVLALLGFCAWYLQSHPNLQRRTLRLFELLIIAGPLVELSLIQWFESSELLADGKGVELEELRAIIFNVVTIYIAVYGIFIPSTWGRTAFITGVMAIIPVAVSVLHQAAHEYPEIIQWMHFANPCLVAVMALVATAGAGIVNQVRLQAESAKHYGQYRLIEEIGHGAMGVVYLAKHQLLKRPAAIKLILAKDAGSPKAIRQFEREVQASATLNHWNTVQIYDYGITEEGDFYCVMEYLTGCTLAERLNQQQTLTLKKTLSIVIQLCDALEEAHHKGLIHRDINRRILRRRQIARFRAGRFQVRNPRRSQGAGRRNTRVHVARTDPGRRARWSQ